VTKTPGKRGVVEKFSVKDVGTWNPHLGFVGGKGKKLSNSMKEQGGGQHYNFGQEGGELSMKQEQILPTKGDGYT